MTGPHAATGLVLALAFGAGAPAHAQDAPASDTLLAGVSCTGEGQADRIMLNAARLAAGFDVVNAELARIGADPAVCAAIQRAAMEVSGELSGPVAQEQADMRASARARLEAVLREAEASAATARFEVGPPPRRLTRGAGRED